MIQLVLILVGLTAGHVYAVEPEGIPDLRSLTQRTDGRFDAVCTDGSQEIVTAAQVQAGEVCRQTEFMLLGQGVYLSDEPGDPGRLILPNYDVRGRVVEFVHIPIRNGRTGLCYDNAFVGRYTCNGRACATAAYGTRYQITARDRLRRNDSYDFVYQSATAPASIPWCN